MQYRLITTQNGLVPIEDIKEGTLVLCNGEWKEAPKPVKGLCYKLYFNNLPTTTFEKKAALRRQFVSVNHKPILNKFESSNSGLVIRACISGTVKWIGKSIRFKTSEDSDLDYWFPKMVQFLGTVKTPVVSEDSIIFYTEVPKLKELSGNDLSERNLEYYLEGLLRKRFVFMDNRFKIFDKLSETDLMVLRLLDINIYKVHLGTAVDDGITILKHVKDNYNRKKVTDDMIVTCLKRHISLPRYTPGFEILNKEEVIDWMLPDIQPDINTITCINDSNMSIEQKKLGGAKHIISKSQGSDGRKFKKYNNNNLYEQLMKNS